MNVLKYTLLPAAISVILLGCDHVQSEVIKSGTYRTVSDRLINVDKIPKTVISLANPDSSIMKALFISEVSESKNDIELQIFQYTTTKIICLDIFGSETDLQVFPAELTSPDQDESDSIYLIPKNIKLDLRHMDSKDIFHELSSLKLDSLVQSRIIETGDVYAHNAGVIKLFIKRNGLILKRKIVPLEDVNSDPEAKSIVNLLKNFNKKTGLELAPELVPKSAY